MTDIDHLTRRLSDLETVVKEQGYRLRTLEKPAPKQGYVWVRPDGDLRYTRDRWCECGRDVCRAPDCPSHKTDPLGR